MHDPVETVILLTGDNNFTFGSEFWIFSLQR